MKSCQLYKSLKPRASRLGAFAVMMALSIVCALAQTTGSTSGDDGYVGAIAPNWAASAGGMQTGIGNIVQGIFPYAVGLMVLFMGPRIFKKLIASFSR